MGLAALSRSECVRSVSLAALVNKGKFLSLLKRVLITELENRLRITV